MWIDGNNLAFNPAAAHTIDGTTYNGNILMFPEVVAQLGLTEIPNPQPPEGYDPDLYFRTEQPEAPYVVYTPKSQEQVAEVMLGRFIAAMEAHYDAKAKERKYDNRLTCALRAGYPGPFQSEGQAFAVWMDTANAYGYTQMELVMTGQRTMPTIAEFIAELPVLEWPAA